MNMAQRFLGHKPQCSASNTLCGLFEKLRVENTHEAVIGTQLPAIYSKEGGWIVKRPI